MDVKQLAQDTVDSFNNRTYKEKAREVTAHRKSDFEFKEVRIRKNRPPE